MNITALLLILWCLQGEASGDSDKPLCIYQLGSVTVEVGGSITIPCKFTVPEDLESTTVASVSWRSGSNNPCGGNAFIYNHTENWTHTNYTGRISMVGKPKELKTASIRIQELRRTDGPMFCCRVELVNEEDTITVQWQNRHGTFIRFPDEIWASQLEVIHALPGESVAIPCYIHYPAGSDMSVERVIWRNGSSLVCRDNTEIRTRTSENNLDRDRPVSVVNFPANISLYLENVSSSDNSQYCCEAKTEQSTYTSALGTQLSVGDYTSVPGFTVLQPAETYAHVGDSVTISCSINYPPEEEPLWTGVYWRVHSTRGHYSYHPSQSMVHSRYRGRTELRGQMDLHIQGVQDPDNDTHYCLVILRFCAGLNTFKTSIIHGNGTRLILTEEAHYTEIIASLCALLIVAILCVILICLKRRGVICAKPSTKEDVGRPTPPADPPSAPTHPEYDSAYECASAPPTGQEESGGILYAQLNIVTRNKGKTDQQTRDDPQVLYAAVRPTH